jgi:hypothetical protein
LPIGTEESKITIPTSRRSRRLTECVASGSETQKKSRYPDDANRRATPRAAGEVGRGDDHIEASVDDLPGDRGLSVGRRRVSFLVHRGIIGYGADFRLVSRGGAVITDSRTERRT